MYRLSAKLRYRISRIKELLADCERRFLALKTPRGGVISRQTHPILKQYIKRGEI